MDLFFLGGGETPAWLAVFHGRLRADDVRAVLKLLGDDPPAELRPRGNGRYRLATFAPQPVWAAFGNEALLFRLAGQLERARPWRGRRPPTTA